MSRELWDIYSANGEKLGKKAVRGKSVLKNGEYHLVVHIWVVSSKGDYLIQKRSESKKLMPGEWAATGGAAIAGENDFAAAKRELKEELGIESDEQTLKKIFELKRRNSFLSVFCIKKDVDENELTLQKSEVDRVKWVDEDTLKDMIKNGKYHNYGEEYFNNLFSAVKDFSAAYAK